MVDSGRTYYFSDFIFDPEGRELRRGAERIPLSARYFDALALLLKEQGKIVSKDRFFDDVWGDVVVSDNALTQCIKDIRKALGDNPAAPRFIETVPRYGYRFIADVFSGDPPGVGQMVEKSSLTSALTYALAGTAGGGLAGLAGGVLYGFALAGVAPEETLGAASVVAVMASLTAFIGILGGIGVSAGLATGRLLFPLRPVWTIPTAAVGGMVIGTGTKLLGVDAFNLLLGRTPAGITGGLEGAALGAALATGLVLAGGPHARRPWRPVLGAALATGIAGILIPLAGGRLLGGSLNLLANSFSTSRLELDALGRFFGELEFGMATQVALGGLEGFLFGAGVAGALTFYERVVAQPE